MLQTLERLRRRLTRTPYGPRHRGAFTAIAWLVLPPVAPRADREATRIAFAIFTPGAPKGEHLAGLYWESPWPDVPPRLTHLFVAANPMRAQRHFLKLVALGLPDPGHRIADI